ncbi:hypothetical protein PtA15_12A184 [Puccinia triticina]|uniref:Uncharacterized protein n=1 Tax=Puccinia triticina TaxID=208348 RepID=A0ABY7CZ67_9BASI|nr:uncharacterized protein PtA15_12A184 [Puccinia triticina]WAQ90198.1 hypothetical protein PtA15_12A184 [Puccinia triticina]
MSERIRTLKNNSRAGVGPIVGSRRVHFQNRTSVARTVGRGLGAARDAQRSDRPIGTQGWDEHDMNVVSAIMSLRGIDAQNRRAPARAPFAVSVHEIRDLQAERMIPLPTLSANNAGPAYRLDSRANHSDESGAAGPDTSPNCSDS